MGGEIWRRFGEVEHDHDHDHGSDEAGDEANDDAAASADEAPADEVPSARA